MQGFNVSAFYYLNSTHFEVHLNSTFKLCLATILRTTMAVCKGPKLVCLLKPLLSLCLPLIMCGKCGIAKVHTAYKIHFLLALQIYAQEGLDLPPSYWNHIHNWQLFLFLQLTTIWKILCSQNLKFVFNIAQFLTTLQEVKGCHKLLKLIMVPTPGEKCSWNTWAIKPDGTLVYISCLPRNWTRFVNTESIFEG